MLLFRTFYHISSGIFVYMIKHFYSKKSILAKSGNITYGYRCNNSISDWLVNWDWTPVTGLGEFIASLVKCKTITEKKKNATGQLYRWWFNIKKQPPVDKEPSMQQLRNWTLLWCESVSEKCQVEALWPQIVKLIWCPGMWLAGSGKGRLCAWLFSTDHSMYPEVLKNAFEWFSPSYHLNGSVPNLKKRIFEN